MDDKNFEILNAKLDAIMKAITESHKEQFNWAQALNFAQVNSAKQLENRQMRIERAFNISDETLPFEPIYNRAMNISPAYPEIFNKYGEPMQVYFIHDDGFAHAPQNKNSRYIIWDRYNYGLPIHFYTYNQIFQTVGKPKKKYALVGEPRSILPQVYQRILANKDYIEKNFDAIFTHDSEILSTFKNAKLYLPGWVWYGQNMEGNMFDGQKQGLSNDGGDKDIVISVDNYKRKNKNISMISSHKEMCPLHVLRKNLALKFKNNPGGLLHLALLTAVHIVRVSYLLNFFATLLLSKIISAIFISQKKF